MDTNKGIKMMTIPQIAKTGLLPETALRQMLRQGQLPAIQVKSRTYVNYYRLIAILEELGNNSNTEEN